MSDQFPPPSPQHEEYQGEDSEANDIERQTSSNNGRTRLQITSIRSSTVLSPTSTKLGDPDDFEDKFLSPRSSHQQIFSSPTSPKFRKEYRPDTGSTVTTQVDDLEKGHDDFDEIEEDIEEETGSIKSNETHVEDIHIDKKEETKHQRDETDETVEDGKAEEKSIRSGKTSIRQVGTLKDPYEVVWEAGDKGHPWNWSENYRWFLTLFAAFITLNASFASSCPSQNVPTLMRTFGFSIEVGTLTISIFVAGYIAGPLFWGPGSELFGRRACFITSFIPYLGFNVGCALSKNTASILIFRFLAGIFASCPLVSSGSIMGDLWEPKQRGIAMTIFSVAPFAGPALGPLVSGWIETAGVDWRWTFWVLTIYTGVLTVAIILFLPETYPAFLLAKKAQRIRNETGDEKYWCAYERKDRSIKGISYDTCIAPWVMFLEEPMLLAVTLYMSFVYGLLYLLFEAFPVIFAQIHGFNPGFTGLTFLSIFVGSCISALIYLFFVNPGYVKLVDQYAPKPVPPEARLPQAIAAASVLPIAIFWMAWTCYSSISYWSPLLAGVLLGAGIVNVFLAFITYLVDVYLAKSGTALAANTIMRSMAGAGFPLFARQMIDTLDIHWAMSLLGFLSFLGMPLALVLYKYGAKLRAMSKNAHKVR